MSEDVIAPASEDELQAVVAQQRCVLPVGNRTKPPLSACDAATLVSLRSLRGIIEYEPSEFTFTAHAGTTVSDVSAVLAERGQYLPFDPMLVDAGATMGGTVAAGLSGPGRFRYGGIRDFLLGVRFLSGDGEVINAGGKVVKNAAGFDIPKFLVGSLGRFGVMTEMTFKVFPKPTNRQSLKVQCQSTEQAIDRIAVAASSRWELDAIDYRPAESSILLRIAGPEQAAAGIEEAIRSQWGGDVAELDDAESFWRSVGELNWIADAPIAVKIPVTSSLFIRLSESLAADQVHLSVAGNVVWVLLRDPDELSHLDSQLQELAIAGLVIRGPDAAGRVDPMPYRIGRWHSSQMLKDVKSAMDPAAKFPAEV